MFNIEDKRKAYAAASFPVTMLDMDITEICPLACAYCYKAKMVGSKMDLPLAEQVIDTLFFGHKTPGPRSVHFFGGEPLAAWEVIKYVVNYARQVATSLGSPYSFQWGCTSSLLLLDEEKASFFRETGGSIHASIDGTPKAHDRTRKFHNGKGSSEEVAAKVPLALSITPADTARLTIPATNVHLLFDSVVYIRSLGFTGCAPIPVFEDTWTAQFWNDLDDQLRQLTEWWCNLFISGQSFYLKYLSDDIQSIVAPVKKQFPCGAGRTLLAVDMKGTVSPCHRFAGALKTERQLGHISQPLNQEALREFAEFDARGHSWPECATCDAYYACSGGCPHVNMLYWGRIDRKHPNHCKFSQMTYRHSQYAFRRIARDNPARTLQVFKQIVPGRA